LEIVEKINRGQQGRVFAAWKAVWKAEGARRATLEEVIVTLTKKEVLRKIQVAGTKRDRVKRNIGKWATWKLRKRDEGFKEWKEILERDVEEERTEMVKAVKFDNTRILKKCLAQWKELALIY